MSEAPSIEERIARSVVYLVASRVVIQAFATLSGLMVARWLSPGDYGVIALAGTMTIAINMLGEMGAGAAIIQFQDLEQSELNAAFWATVLLSALLYGAVYAAAPLLAAYFSSPTLSPVLRVIGVGAFLNAVRVVPDSLLRKRLRLDRVAVVEIVAVGLNTPLVLGLAWAGAGVWALATGAVFGALVQCLLSFSLTRWRPGLRVGSRRIRQVWRYSRAALGSKLSWSVYNQSDRIVLGRLGGEVTLGYYAMASQLALLPIEKGAVMINQILAPLLAECQADRGSMSRVLLRGVRLVGWLVFPISFGLLAFADSAVTLLLTAKWRPIIPVLQLLCLYAATRSLALLFPPVLLATYRADLLFVYNLVLLVVLPVGFGVGAWLKGALGVAAAWTILYPPIAVWMVHCALRLLGIGWSTLGRALGPPAASTIVMIAAAVTVQRALVDDDIVGLILAILTGALVHGVAFMFFGGSVQSDIRRLLGTLRTRSYVSEPVLPEPTQTES